MYFKNLLKTLLCAMVCTAGAGVAAAQDSGAARIELGRVLIAYYSMSGKTQEVAQIIARKTGGTLYRIETSKTYSGFGVLHAAEAKKELESGNLPPLVSPVPDAAAYDLVIMGAPVWRHTMATPAVMFLRKCNFKGKWAAAYATNKGNVGTFFEFFAHNVQNAKVLTGEEFHNKLSGTDQLESKITVWLLRLQSEMRKGKQ